MVAAQTEKLDNRSDAFMQVNAGSTIVLDPLDTVVKDSEQVPAVSDVEDDQHTVLSTLHAKGKAWLHQPRTPKGILLKHCPKCEEDPNMTFKNSEHDV